MRALLLFIGIVLGFVIGMVVGITLDKPQTASVEVIPDSSDSITISGNVGMTSDDTKMSYYEAIVWLENGIASHQYYLDHPELQNRGTGDSAFQIKTIRQYNRLKGLMEKLADGTP